MPIDSEKSRALFLHAVGKLPDESWDEYLQVACAGDDELCRHVQNLLDIHRRSTDFLESPAPGLDRLLHNSDTIIDSYVLRERIGEGGMGVVYLAHQSEPVQRTVALKVIKPGMNSQQIIARFDAERQALSMMDHANIARVLDCGSTTSDCPYFVMELVRGQPITNYCDDNRLTPHQRLELFVPICHAIQHAHQKGIIHRDIKPSNVMVAMVDGTPVPKVIDFGVAKATGAIIEEQTRHTQHGMVIGTLEYMSPEQANLSADGIDTRSDIYSLGVLLYELLTGTTPVWREHLSELAYVDALRLITEHEPIRPSVCLRGAGSLLPSIAEKRMTDSHRLIKLVGGELDWIVMKCLDKDRSRRYDTANDLALDLTRYLNDEPVLACPPSLRYRFGKFARRKKPLLAIYGILALALCLGVVGLLMNLRLIQRENEQKEILLTEVIREKDRADRNLTHAREAVKRYLVEISDNPLLASGDFQGLRRELLQTAIPFYEEFVDQDQANPDLGIERGRAYLELGYLRQGIGELEQASKDLLLAQAIFRTLAENDPNRPEYRFELATSYESRASILDDLGQLSAAEYEYRQAITLLTSVKGRRLADPEYRALLSRAQSNLGLLLMKSDEHRADAEPFLRAAVSMREELVISASSSVRFKIQLSQSWHHIGTFCRETRRTEEANQAFQRVFEVLTPNVVGEAKSNPSERVQIQHVLAQTWNNLGSLRREAGKITEAEDAYRQAVAIKQELVETFPSLPQYRHELAASLNNLGSILQVTKRVDAAHEVFQQSILLDERLMEDFPDNPSYAIQVAGTYANVGRLWGDQGKLEQSLPFLSKAIRLLEKARTRQTNSAKVRESMLVAYWARAMTLAGLQRFTEALQDWDAAIQSDDGRYEMSLRIRRASNLLQLKEHARAVVDANAVVSAPHATADDLYDACCVFAIAAEFAMEDLQLADSYAAEAVRSLHKAVDRGYTDIQQIQSAADLDGLRARPDFQTLVNEILQSGSRAEPES